MGETSSKPAERIRNSPPISHVLAMKGCPEVIDNLNNCLKYKLLRHVTVSAGCSVPAHLTSVLNRNGCPHLMDYLNNCLKHKNTKAIEHTGTLLSDMGLDNITAAFKKAAEENMICHRCKKEIKFIDELCYCPEDLMKMPSWHEWSNPSDQSVMLGITPILIIQSSIIAVNRFQIRFNTKHLSMRRVGNRVAFRQCRRFSANARHSRVPAPKRRHVCELLHIVTHEYIGGVECSLRPGERLVLVDNGDPDWKHGFKVNDYLERLVTFPSTCVAAYRPEERPMRLVRNCNLLEQKMRLYRDQIVFVQPNSLESDGRVLVRNEHNKFIQCPIQFLTTLA
ncbi:hypothetical protein GPALN_005956 [Globodera pallida]|nr:hypothetical protein GPALN_005956 [Globodera pallida]